MKKWFIFVTLVGFSVGCGDGDPISTPISKLAVADELSAQFSLKAIVSAEEQYLQSEGGAYWVRDVSGLYRKLSPAGREIMILPPGVAGADAVPVPAEEGVIGKPLGDKPDPKAGYLFKTIAADETGAPYEGSRKFAFCAFPADYGKSGAKTFIVNQEGKVHAKDTGGKPVDQWPANPSASGWITK